MREKHSTLGDWEVRLDMRCWGTEMNRGVKQQQRMRYLGYLWCWCMPLIPELRGRSGQISKSKACLVYTVSSRFVRDIIKWDLISRNKQASKANTQTKPYYLKRLGPKEFVQLLLCNLKKSAWENYINQWCGYMYRGQGTTRVTYSSLVRVATGRMAHSQWLTPLMCTRAAQIRLNGLLKKKGSKVGREKWEGRQREWAPYIYDIFKE